MALSLKRFSSLTYIWSIITYLSTFYSFSFRNLVKTTTPHWYRSLRLWILIVLIVLISLYQFITGDPTKEQARELTKPVARYCTWLLWIFTLQYWCVFYQLDKTQCPPQEQLLLTPHLSLLRLLQSLCNHIGTNLDSKELHTGLMLNWNMQILSYSWWTKLSLAPGVPEQINLQDSSDHNYPISR